MGLLEQVLKRLESIEAKLDGQSTTATVETTLSESATDAVERTGEVFANAGKSVTTETTKINETVDSNVELDNAGVPWDQRIHSDAKGKKQDGTWKRRRNLSDEFYNSVLAEIKGADVTNEEPVAEKPVTPAKPGVPAKPSSPLKPTVPTKPASGELQTETAPLVPLIDRITSHHGVAPATVSSELNTKFGVEFVSNLTSEQIAEAKTWLAGWADYLDNIDDCIGDIDDLHKAHPADGLNDGVDIYLTNHGSTNNSLGTVPKANLSGLYTDLNTFYSQWNNYYKTL